MPTRFLGATGWPLPVGRRADAVGGGRPGRRDRGQRGACTSCPWRRSSPGRRRGVPGLLVVHGSGERQQYGPRRRRARCARRSSGSIGAAGGPAVADGLRLAGRGRGGAARLRRRAPRYLPYPLPELPRRRAGGAPRRRAAAGRVDGPARGREGPAARRAGGRAAARDAARRARALRRGAAAARRWRRSRPSGPWLTLRGARPWPEVLDAHARAHVCLSTSVWDNVQVAVLEALARGVPGRLDPGRRRAALLPRARARAASASRAAMPTALGGALGRLASGYAAHRRAFADNGRRARGDPSRRPADPHGADRGCPPRRASR